jgi:hypothetical protein
LLVRRVPRCDHTQYDDTGERVIKRTSQGETAYINQFWTARNRSIGTKHIFVGETRISSELSPGEAHVQPPGGRNNNQDLLPDHLGSTSYVTDKDGELYEHVQYFPFGETWVEESSNTRSSTTPSTEKGFFSPGAVLLNGNLDDLDDCGESLRQPKAQAPESQAGRAASLGRLLT